MTAVRALTEIACADGAVITVERHPGSPGWEADCGQECPPFPVGGTFRDTEDSVLRLALWHAQFHGGAR